jgi:signal transduction histidine kinase
MRSLRRRAIVTAVAWALGTAAVGFFALLTYFSGAAEARFERALLDRHLQVVVALANSGGDPAGMELSLPDPDFARPYSGSYWQLTAPDGEVIASRSLFDATLPETGAAGAEPALWRGPGPDGPVLGAHQRITLEDGGVWTVAAAESLATLDAERRQIGQSLLTAFALVGSLVVVGAALLLGAALRPLARLREDVAHRWDAGEALDPASYPDEVAPLVADINLLIARNRKVIDGARRQAADLAHALKTPSAVLRNELARLKARRGATLATAEEALDRIDAQIARSLVRIRAGDAAAVTYRTDLAASVERLGRLFRRAPGAAGLDLAVEIDAGLTVPVDRQDLEEVLGNLLENAMKWRRDRVRLAAWRDEADVVIVVEDDGPGIPEDRRAEALRPGGRLDTAAPGSGLGLAIAGDLVAAYDGRIALATAPGLGGLSVRITLPATRSPFGGAPAAEA